MGVGVGVEVHFYKVEPDEGEPLCSLGMGSYHTLEH